MHEVCKGGTASFPSGSWCLNAALPAITRPVYTPPPVPRDRVRKRGGGKNAASLLCRGRRLHLLPSPAADVVGNALWSAARRSDRQIPPQGEAHAPPRALYQAAGTAGIPQGPPRLCLCQLYAFSSARSRPFIFKSASPSHHISLVDLAEARLTTALQEPTFQAQDHAPSPLHRLLRAILWKLQHCCRFDVLCFTQAFLRG